MPTPSGSDQPPNPVPVPIPVELESFKAIADLAQREYTNENDRTKSLDGKAGALIGATGAATAFVIGTLVKPPATITNSGDTAELFYVGAIFLALIGLFVAQVFFLRSVALRGQFRRIDLDDWLDLSVMHQPGWQTYSELAATYDRAIQLNTTLNDDKAGFQAKGLRSLLAGTICLAVIPATVLVVIVLGMLPGR